MFLGTAALFSLALTLGGLGPHAPLLGGLIVVAAYPLLVAIVVFGGLPEAARADSVAPVLFLLLMLTLGASQLIPLPASSWRALPNRDVSVMVLETLRLAQRGRPLSLAPEDTRLVVEAWLPPMAIFLSTMMASRVERERLAWLVLGAGLLGSLLGLLQLSFADGTLFPYPEPPFTRFPGLFANYNHEAVFLGAAVALLPAFWPGEAAGRNGRRSGLAIFWVLALFGLLITASRAGLALFALSSLVAGARIVGSPGQRRGSAAGPFGNHRRRAIAVVVAGAALLAIVGWIGSTGYRAELMSSRFGDVGADARFEFWRTSLAAALSYLPYGAGFGTFEAVYQIAEPLEQVRDYLVNHAHNDYLELFVEAGVGGVLLIALFTVWFGARLTALARARDPTRSAGVERRDDRSSRHAALCRRLSAPNGGDRLSVRLRMRAAAGSGERPVRSSERASARSLAGGRCVIAVACQARRTPPTRLLLALLIAPPLVGATSTAEAQTVRIGAAAEPDIAAPAPLPGTALGGPGRRALGGLGAARIEGRPAPAAAPAPAPPAEPSSFQTVADAIDCAADPS